MNQKRHHLAIDLINTLMRFIIAYLIVSMLLHIIDPNSALHTLFLFPAPFISYAIRKHTAHIWSFLLLHLILAALYVLTVGNILVIAVYGAYLILLTIMSYYRKHKAQEGANASPYAMILFVLLYLCGYLANMPDMMRLCFVLAIAYTLLHILNRYLLNLDLFVHNHEHIANLPYHQIRNSNNVLVAFLCGLFFIAMLLFSRVPLGNIAYASGKLILRVLRFLFSLLHFRESEEPEKATGENEIFAEEPELPPAEPSRIMELIAKIFQWLAVILAVAAIVFLVLYVIYKLYRYFYLKGEEEVKDQVEFISPFIKKERLKKGVKPALRKLFGRSNNAVIRKYFARAVASNIASDTKLPESLTPTQLSEYAIGGTGNASASKDEEKREQLTSYYEKARYGNKECTRKEVQLVKHILK